MRELKEALTELGIQLHFYATEQEQGFYFARTSWPVPRAAEDIPHGDDTFSLLSVEEFPMLAYREIRACILYRKAWKARKAAYCIAVYKSVPFESHIMLLHDVGAALTQLSEHGYTGREMWIPETREAHYHYIAPSHQGKIWTLNTFEVELRNRKD